MTDERFDRLTRRLATAPTSRRGMFGVIGGVITGTAMSSVFGPLRASAQQCTTNNDCPGGYSCCSGTCVDLATDMNNCGSCDNACRSGQGCTRGVCGMPTGCPSGQSYCSGKCVDLSKDVNNCGACGQHCAPRVLCVNGACKD